MSIMEENELIMKAVKWTIAACSEVEKAGGSPQTVISHLSSASVTTMVRNNLVIKFSPPEAYEPKKSASDFINRVRCGEY